MTRKTGRTNTKVGERLCQAEVQMQLAWSLHCWGWSLALTISSKDSFETKGLVSVRVGEAKGRMEKGRPQGMWKPRGRVQRACQGLTEGKHHKQIR